MTANDRMQWFSACCIQSPDCLRLVRQRCQTTVRQNPHGLCCREHNSDAPLGIFCQRLIWQLQVNYSHVAPIRLPLFVMGHQLCDALTKLWPNGGPALGNLLEVLLMDSVRLTAGADRGKESTVGPTIQVRLALPTCWPFRAHAE